MYSFKDITTVPTAKGLVDIVLSQTQRRTPTQVHPQFKVTRIRQFYMRKVKYAQQAFHDKLATLLKEFPKIDDINPFYSQLCNVLYDRDHYKLALGHVNATERVIDSIGKDYVRLLKYADSPYKCKMLKHAAFGRMCKSVSKLSKPLAYLEEVRMHLSRLPSINPNTRTLILTGYPNVGKSSFINLVSRANVEVQPYAFTTRSLYVGHFDYGYIRWQILDTPGILDHPLENRNTIELTAITALAYLQAAILFIVDISEECGFSIEQQVALFNNIKTLFKGKPLVVIYNKTDVRKFDELPNTQQELLKGMINDLTETRAVSVECSCLNASGVDEAKNIACDMLLENRVSEKLDSHRVESIDNRLNIVGMLNPDRPPNIPESVLKKKQREMMCIDTDNDNEQKLMLTKDLEELQGGPGVFSIDLNSEWKLEKPSFTYDIFPEFFCGKNVMDFIDPDIEERLNELEREETELLQNQLDDISFDAEDWKKTSSELDGLMRKIQLRRIEHRLNRNSSRVPVLPRTVLPRANTEMARMKSLDVPTRKTRRHRRAEKIAEAEASGKMSDAVTEEDEIKRKQHKKVQFKTISKKTTAEDSLKVKQLLSGAIQRHHSNALELSKTSGALTKKTYMLRRTGKGALKGKSGDADHFIGNKRPKHLFRGKTGIGKKSHR